MIRRGLRLALGLGVAAAVVVVLLAAGLLWRLARGPIVLHALRPRLEAALTPAGGSARLGAVELVWDGRRRLQLRARDVRLADADGRLALAIPSVTVRLGVGALLRGRFVVTAAEAIGPRLVLERGADGAVRAAPPALLDQFVAPAPGSPLAALGRLTIRDADVALTDRTSEPTWQIGPVTLELRRERAGIGLRLDAAGCGTRVAAEGRLAPDGTLSVAGALGAVAPKAALACWPDLVAADTRRWVAAHVADGRLEDVRFALAGRLEPATAALTDARLDGSFAFQDLGVHPPGGLPALTQVDGTGTFAVGGTTLEVGARLEATACGSRVAAAGHLVADGILTVEATLGSIATDAAVACWPAEIAAEARRWVAAHVGDGRVEHVRLALTGRLEPTTGALTVGRLEGSFAYRGLDVRFLDGLPPVKAVDGTGTLSAVGATFVVTRGRLPGLQVSAGRVALGGTPLRVAVEARAAGSIGAALTALDEPPLALATAAGLEPRMVGGSLDARLMLSVDPTGPMTPAALDLRATGTLHDVSLAAVGGRWPLAGGTLALTLDARALTLDGTAKVAGAPLRLELIRPLATGTATTLEARGRLDATTRTALGLDTDGWLEGAVDVRAELTLGGRAGDVAVVHADLRPATLDLFLLEKAAGQPGSADVRLRLVRGTIASVEQFSAAAAGATLRASGTRSGDGSRWETFDAQATLPAPAPKVPGADADLSLRPAGAAHGFRVRMSDVGPLAWAIDRGGARGGPVTWAGTVRLAEPGAPLEGRFESGPMTLDRAPWLGRVVTLASLSGIQKALSGGGLRFDRLTATVAQRDGTLTVRDGSAEGPMLGFLLDGTVDMRAATLDLRGSLVPSLYGLNQGADRLPVVGGLVSKVTGGALQVFDFRIRGPAANPNISVDALASIAPGRLRDLVRKLRP